MWGTLNGMPVPIASQRLSETLDAVNGAPVAVFRSTTTEWDYWPLLILAAFALVIASARR